MKSLRSLALIGAGVACAPALQAQSTVTLYGSLDQSAVRISNVGGARQNRVEPSTSQPDRFGFRGTEDLGGGLRAGFQLEAGFATDLGASVAPAFFNRMAVVSLAGPFGSVQLGNQPDLMYDWLAKTSNGFALNNAYAFHPGNFDTMAETFSVVNAIRYSSPNWGGFSVAGLAGASEGSGRNLSAGANYLDGPLRVAAAWSVENQRVLRGFAPFAAASGLPASGAMDKVTNAGLGASVRFGDVTVNALGTQTTLRAQAREAKLRSVDVGASWFVVPLNAVNLGLSQSRLNGARWNTVSLMNLYYFSKRTQVYAQATLQRASDGQLAMINGAGVSSTARQNVLGIGLHHSF